MKINESKGTHKKVFWGLRWMFLVMMMIASIVLVGCQGSEKKSEPLSQSNFQLDTVITISLYDWEEEGIFQETFAEIDRLESLLSVDKEGSDLDKLWKNAGKEWTKVSKETAEVLRSSLQYSRLSDGYFDVTAGPLISLWNIREGTGHIPTAEELKVAQNCIGYQGLLEQGKGEFLLQSAGMKANLGAIAKGYIADCMKSFLMEKGVKSGIINLGGNVVVIGENPEGKPFTIGIQDPLKATGEILGTIQATDCSLVSSGINERYFESEGVRYHHILDPFTGYPSDNGVAGVTILSENSMDGDALSTSVFLLGKEKGLALVESLPGIEALIVDMDGKVTMTTGIKEKVTLY